jgi:hypothetical protein
MTGWPKFGVKQPGEVERAEAFALTSCGKMIDPSGISFLGGSLSSIPGGRKVGWIAYGLAG